MADLRSHDGELIALLPHAYAGARGWRSRA
jgi:hypothetical protein